MSAEVNNLVKRFIKIWQNSETNFPKFSKYYSHEEQVNKESHLNDFLEFVNTSQNTEIKSDAERRNALDRFLAKVRHFARYGLDFSEGSLDIIFSLGFSKVAMEFAREARYFDPEISGADIFQASRNVWAMNSLQNLLGLRVELTPSIFAYSLLYPYSDNFLDDPVISFEEKKQFNERFGRRLVGEHLSPLNKREKNIYELIGKIETQWDRKTFPQVFDSLLAIHHAQIKSIELLQSGINVDVLGICFEKGGASVLADGYLIAGTLTESQKEYLFGNGIWLQLVDDLQDVEQDNNDRLKTVFSQISNRAHFNETSNRAWHFGEKVLDLMTCFPVTEIMHLKNLKKHSQELLFIDAINRAEKYLTRPYLKCASQFFPFRFATVRKHRRKFSKNQFSLMKLIETSVRVHNNSSGIKDFYAK